MTQINPAGNRRVLAIDVRPRRIGYAALDNCSRLLDAATRKMKSPVLATTRIMALIGEFQPSVVVLRRILPGCSRHRPRTKMLQRLICHTARRCSIEIAFVTEQELRDCFQAYGLGTKHEIATMLAKDFPELAWKLHEKRKIYDRERWSMVVFDAVALGVAYLSRGNEGVSDEIQDVGRPPGLIGFFRRPPAT